MRHSLLSAVNDWFVFNLLCECMFFNLCMYVFITLGYY